MATTKRKRKARQPRQPHPVPKSPEAAGELALHWLRAFEDCLKMNFDERLRFWKTVWKGLPHHPD